MQAAAPAWRIALAALVFRGLCAIVAFLANVLFPNYQPDQFPSPFGGSSFWDTFIRYDAGNFYQIARYGYTEGPMAFVPGGRSSIAYFPVYPLLMRYVGRLFGPRPADLYFGGIVVSWVAFALAMVMLVRLARLDLPRARALRAAAVMAVFPFAFFFGVVYSESTFLLLTVTAFYWFRTRRFVLGGVAGGLATATRVNGILMLPALAWVAWRAINPVRPINPVRLDPASAGLSSRADPPSGGLSPDSSPPSFVRDELAALVGLLLVCAGVGVYSLYIYRLSGNPFEWAAAIQRWGYYPGGRPWLALWHLARMLATHPYAYLAGERMAPYDTLNGLSALAFAVATPIIWWRLGAGYGLFMAANLWLPLSSGQFEGMGRYCAVLFPFFIWVAGFHHRRTVTGVLIAFALFYALTLSLFTNIHPIF